MRLLARYRSGKTAIATLLCMSAAACGDEDEAETSMGDAASTDGSFSSTGGADASTSDTSADATSNASADGSGDGSGDGSEGSGDDTGASTSSGSSESGESSSTGDPSDGCGQAPPHSGAQTVNLTVRGTAREFIVVVPSGYDLDRAYPLVFGMHGLTGTGMVIRSYASIEAQTAGNAIHVYPTGLDGMWDLQPTGADVEFFDAMVAWANENLCIDADRIFSYGHSFGGYFSNALGCYRGDVLRAIGPVEGGGPFQASSCTGEVGAIVLHGTDDTTVQIDEGRGSRDFWIGRNGCEQTTVAITPSPCVEYQGCATDQPVVWCEHTGIGHNFPGMYGGALTYGPEAIWSFFSRF